jgi:2-methylcitrate dehydratase PrpD
MSSVTRKLASYAVDTKYADLPQEVIGKVKVATLNILGAAFGGYPTRLADIHLHLAKSVGGGKPEATIIGDGGKVTAPLAAYANASLAFILDYEDMLYYILHPGHTTISAALAIGEKEKASGKDFITAVAMGYEVSGRIGISMQPSLERGRTVWGEQYHPFASVVTAGKLMGLDVGQMEVGFGIAGTYATVPSAYKYFGKVEDTRPMREAKLGWGWMCMAGVFAALSAQAGLKGGRGILDGEEGFWIMAGSDRCDFDMMTKDLGTKYLIMDTEYKLHPSIGWNHPSYTGTKSLVEEHDIKPEDVVKVVVKGMGVDRVADFNPAGMVDAMFSLPYTVATTILKESLGPGMYSDEKMASPEVQRLLKKIELEPDAESEQLWYDKQMLIYTIEMELKDGRHLNKRVEYPHDKPEFGAAEVEAKFRELAGLTLSSKRIEQIIKAVDELDNLDNISDLTGILCP